MFLAATDQSSQSISQRWSSFFLPAGVLQEVGTVRHSHGKSPTEATGHIGGVGDGRSELEEQVEKMKMQLKSETTGTPLSCTRQRGKIPKSPSRMNVLLLLLFFLIYVTSVDGFGILFKYIFCPPAPHGPPPPSEIPSPSPLAVTCCCFEEVEFGSTFHFGASESRPSDWGRVQRVAARSCQELPTEA